MKKTNRLVEVILLQPISRLGAVGDIVAGASGIQGLSNLAPGKAPTTPTVTSKVPEGKLLTALGSVSEQREMVKNRTIFEKLKVFFTKLLISISPLRLYCQK